MSIAKERLDAKLNLLNMTLNDKIKHLKNLDLSFTVACPVFNSLQGTRDQRSAEIHWALSRATARYAAAA